MPRSLAALACAALVCACSTVPRSGPLTQDFHDGAAASPALPFVLIETDGAVVARLRAGEAAPSLVPLAEGPAIWGRRLRTGDQIGVALFEATGGGLFGGPVDGGPGLRALPPQIVSAGGTIRVPYGGEVRVAGLTPEAAAGRIEASLKGQAIEPQAVVSLIASPGSSVSVLGDAVARGAVVPLTGTGERVLDVVAAAGGLTRPIHESALRLTRAKRSAVVEMAALIEQPQQNVPVHPRDVITVEHRPRHFSVLGAVGTSARLTFDKAELTLDEALGMAAGLRDERADPAGVFVLRHERPEVLAAMPGATHARLAAAPGQDVPVVYRLDFSRAAGLLLAQRFPVRHRDLIYIANAEFNSAEKVLGLLGKALQPIATGALLINAAN